MTPDSHSSLLNSLVSEIINIASTLGGLKEAQRLSEHRHALTEGRLATLETTILQTSSSKQVPEADPWWKQLLPPDTLGKFLLWLAPRLLLLGTLAWETIKKVWVAYWQVAS